MKAQRQRPTRRQSKAKHSLRKARRALDVGEEIRAIKHLGSAIEHDPRCVPAYRALAGLLAGRGELRRAQGLLMRAVDVDPSCAEAQLMLGVMLRRRGRHDAALEPLLCATRALPRNPVAWRELGEALLLHGDLEAAYEAFGHVSKLEPGRSAGPIGQAAVAERRGDLEAAIACLQAWTKDPFALCVWGRILRRLGRSDEALPAVAHALETHDHPQVRERLGHVFGELLESVGEYQAALGAHRMANEARLTRYRPDEHTAQIDSIMRRFDALPPVAVSLGAPPVIVIVGMPRSGTSLTETILSRHAEVFAGGELQALGDHASCLPTHPTKGDWAQAGNAYLGSVSDAAGGTGTVTDKLPDNYLHLGFLARMVPSARVIWCRRNAADTCVSAFSQDFGVRLPYTQRLDWLGHRFREHERLMEHWKTVLPLPIHELHYESLAREPEKEIRALLDFCSLPFDDACLRPHESGRVVATASYAQVQKPVHTRSIGRAQKFASFLAPLREALDGDVRG